jgi:hypothetical protein
MKRSEILRKRALRWRRWLPHDRAKVVNENGTDSGARIGRPRISLTLHPGYDCIAIQPNRDALWKRTMP